MALNWVESKAKKKKKKKGGKNDSQAKVLGVWARFIFSNFLN